MNIYFCEPNETKSAKAQQRKCTQGQSSVTYIYIYKLSVRRPYSQKVCLDFSGIRLYFEEASAGLAA